MMNRKKILLASCFSFALLASAQTPLPYRDATLTPTQRAEDLLSRLTLEEKVFLMQNNSKAVERLGIKPYEWWNEALHGVGRAGIATVFPQAIGMGATFDSDLVYHVFDAVSDEARAKNRLARENNQYKRYQGLTFWTPNINIFRDPRWGRGQETYGEDPYLTGQLGMAVVRGLQGPADSPYDKAHACAKHYAVHSGPEWNRHSFNAENVAPRDLWETYMPAFKDLVAKAGVKEVMCAYNRFEGEPCCGSNRLLMQILRDEWKYKGIVVSDCWAIADFFTPGHHETQPDAAHASSNAVLSGTDLECGSAYADLGKAVQQGLINEKDIDTAVGRLLKARFELGEMDEHTPWDSIPASVINSEAHRALALKAAHESIVLLQNKSNLLPLSKQAKVAVVGPNANDSVMQWGNYNGTPGQTSTLLQAIRSYLPASQVIYDYGCDRVSSQTFVSAFDQCKGTAGQGFDATFWDNPTFTGSPIAKCVLSASQLYTTDGGTAFAAGVPLENFSVSFTTTFTPKVTQTVSFYAQQNGASEIYIDGKRVASSSERIRLLTSVYSFEAKAGKNYQIEVKYKSGSHAGFKFDLGHYTDFSAKQLLAKVKDVDVVVFAGGISPSLEGEEMPVNAEGFRGGDRTDIQLPKVQRQLLDDLKKAGKKVVFVHYSGSAMGLVPETQSCDAIVQAWYPGQAGGQAVGDVLFGTYNPSGRLPVTFYKDTLQLPDFQDYSMKGRTYRYMRQKPLFSFGYGLSYTTFSYGTPRVENGKLLVDIRNTGHYDGEEVAQLYVQRPGDAEGPVKTLRGFCRLNIPKGETRTAQFPLTDETFEWWDAQSNTMRPLSGTYRLMCGGCSDDDALQCVDYQHD